VGRKRGERSVERGAGDRGWAAERRAGVTQQICLSAEPQIGRSHSAHMICAAVKHNNGQAERDKTKM